MKTRKHLLKDGTEKDRRTREKKKKRKKSYESKKSRRINLSIKKKFFLMDISGRTMSF